MLFDQLGNKNFSTDTTAKHKKVSTGLDDAETKVIVVNTSQMLRKTPKPILIFRKTFHFVSKVFLRRILLSFVTLGFIGTLYKI